MTAYDKPLPKIDTLTRPFWELAKDHKLAVQMCNECGDRHFPAGPVCPKCLGKDQGWDVVSGRGTIFSWVTFHRAYWNGFARDLPYDVCLVELDEGPFFVASLVGVAEGGIAVGDRVEVCFEKVTDEVTLPKFKPAT